MKTKVDIINDAYSQLRISGLTVNPTPEDIAVAQDRLENMMYQFEARNVIGNYTFEDDPDLNTIIHVDPAHYHTMATNLAVRLIPDFNKAVPPTLMAQASQSLSTSSGISANELMRQVPYPSRQARGSGNTLRYNRWQRFYRIEEFSPPEVTTNFIFIGDVNDYTESFESYLMLNETIASYDITADPRLTLGANSQDGNSIDYRISAVDNAQIGSFQQVRIIVTTSTDRKETRLINFQIVSSQRVGENQA